MTEDPVKETPRARVHECVSARALAAKAPGRRARPALSLPGAATGPDGHRAGTAGLHALTPTQLWPPRGRFPAPVPGPRARPREAQSRRVKFKAAPHRAAGFVPGGRGGGETQGQP